jgi:hypothetical protein
VFQGALAGPLDDRAVGERVTEGDAEFDDGGTGVDCSQDYVARGGEIGIPGGDVGNEGRFVVEMKWHEGIW